VLPKVISINIVYFDLGEGDDYVYHSSSIFKGIHTNNELQLSDLQCKKYDKKIPADIYPEYYILKIKQFDDKAKDKLDEWIYFFKHNSVKDEFIAKGLDKVRKTLLYDNLTPEEKKEYDRILDIHLQNETMIYTAEYKGELRGEEKARQEYEQKLSRERAEKERERAEKEYERAEKERERAEKEAANAALANERAEKEASNTALANALAKLDALENNK
jgi:hypothetical protein